VSPYPMDPVDATGPMRLVLTAFPDRTSVDRAVADVLGRRLAACATVLPARSRYWWKGTIESADEQLVILKTVPKRVGALFRRLQELHPYEVPEIVELDVPRVSTPYLEYLAATIDADAPPLPLGGGSPGRSARRSGSPRGREARRPARTPGRPRRR
jgi:periplasmic divalent cation tolerance protein